MTDGAVARNAPPMAAPIAWMANGAARVAGTRVPLELVLWAHQDGKRPEEIAAQYPTLRTDDVYAALAYCLRNPDETEAYLRETEADAEAAEAELDARYPDRREHAERILARAHASRRERRGS